MKYIKNYFDELKKTIDEMPLEDIKKVVDILYEAYKKNKQIFIIGNGGSASTASHFACDLSKGTLHKVYEEKEKRFRVISLTDNVAILTAFGNDLSYEDVFSQQLKNLINPGDIVIAITGSGNSKNILNAVDTASRNGAITVGFLGFDGGKLKEKVNCHIHVPSNHYGRIEDIHLILEHIISSYLSEMKRDDKTVDNEVVS